MASASPHLQIPEMADDLVRVETTLHDSARADDDFLTEVTTHLIRAGGKRMRPAFAIAAAATAPGHSGPASEEAVLGGVSVELVHLGSLYHDDVMDDATTRRTVESVNARWGNLKAILAGDFLLARASEIAAGLGTEIAVLLAATIGRLCEGQVRELKDVYRVDRTPPDYIASIAGKTAALFATAGRVGALVADLPPARVETFTTFGREYGMAFQVVDDILDLVATTEQLGKPSGNDLVEGVYTLPVIHTLDGPDGDELAAILGSPLDDDQREKARAVVLRGDGIDHATAVAQGYVTNAIAALEPLDDGPVAAGLRMTAEYLIERIETIDAI